MNIISKWLSSETVKKSACRYALQRYLGQFWEGNLELEQLTVDLLNGMCRVSDITLRVEALNEHAQQYDLPLEFIDGSIGNLSLSVPWSTDATESSYVEVSGLRITIQPRQRTDPSTSTFESMWNSMTASIEADKENVEQEPGDCNPVDGVRIFTRVIDSMIASFKVRFINTVIRLEHVPLESTNGVALEMCIDRFEYVDDAGSAPSDLSDLPSDEDKTEKAFLGTAFGSKKIYMEGVSFNVDEFPSSARTFCKSVITSRCSTPESGASSTETMHTPPDNDYSHLGSSNPMLVGKITGRQEIRLKHKQNADAQGPRFEVDVSLGSFILFLTPRQVHILTELSRGLAEPETEDISNVPPRSYKEKPLLNIDYSRIEQELMQHLNPPPIRSADLRNIHGWSTGSVDESDNEEEFHPMRRPGMTDSIASTSLTLDESFCSSSTRSGYTNTRRPRKHKTSVDSDPSEEISQLSLRISSVAISVLHEDILTLGVETEGPTLTSINQLRKMSEAFFDAIGVFAMDYGNKNFEGALQTFQNAVKVSHIRLLAAPLVIDTMVKETNDGRMISGNLTLASIDIAECLIDDTDVECPKTDFVELLKFVVCDDDSFTRTDVRMRFKHTQKALRHAQLTKYTHPRTEVNMTIEPCRSEFDITMVDRISALLNPAPICIRNPFTAVRNPWDEQTPERIIDQAVESPMATASVLDIKMSCPKIAFKIRFPVPDLRPLHDTDRAPWWVRSVRPDFASLYLTEPQLHTSIDGRSAFDSRNEIQCRDMFMTYTEADGESTIEFARSHVDERPDEYVDRESQFGWPRIVISLHPQIVGGPLESDSEEDGPTSLEEALAEPPYDPSPFSSSRMVHESDTPHSESGTQDKEGEELIVPGNRGEMTDFISYGTRGAKVQLEILLPCLSVQIPSKQLYEEIYNRFNTDLLLWRPSAPKPTHRGQDVPLSLNLNPGQLQGSIHPKFSMCKSGIQGDSDGDSDDDIFVSTANKSFHHKTTVKKEKKKDGPSQLALTLTIPQGVLSMYTPVRDAMSNVIPGQQGELIFRVEDATVFCITSYKGDPNLGYVCTMIKDVSLSHCGMITMPSTIPPLRSIHSVTPAYCKPTIYRSELGLEDTNRDMLSVAVRIQGAHDTHHIKTFRVSLGLRNATLRHRVYATPTSWHAQLMDCFDVLDHPVAGYSPPGVLTELHLHLYDSAIDYRPLFLPYRTMLTLGSFSVSSNIAAKTNTSTLRFMAENLGLFVSEKIGNFVDLRRDYICLMDMSLFELSLRLNDKMCGGEPKYDLRVSNNILNIRTCSDSGRVLTQLLSYFANDGDLGINDLSSDSFGIPISAEGSLFDDDSVPDHITKSREEVLTNLMEDAMMDTVKKFMPNAELRKKKEEPDADVFCFPDESHPASMTAEMSYSPTAPNDSDDDTDDEFCIIGEDAGTGIVPKSGIPEVRWLTEDTVRVHENHFAIPVGKTDPLKAPKNFPNAVTRYTICEMSIIWHIYGGKDFGNPAIIKKRVTIDDSYSRSRPSSAASSRMSSHDLRSNSTQNSPRHSKSNNNDLYTKGGPNRKTDVLMELQMSKIRFQHEAYPDDTAAAARQVLLIQDIEIRDKLEVSDINKFLYQYNCEAKPKQTHANMLVIRANHMRPDPRSAAQECSVKVSLLPIRLNVDQDSLLFLIEFFTDLAADGGITLETPQPGPSSWPGSKQGTPTHQPPVFSTNYDSDDEDIDSIHENIMRNAQTDENLLFFSEDEPTIRENRRKPKRSVSSQDGYQPTYFRSIVFGPEVLIKIDYHGKRLDLTHGSFTGVLMALGQLSNSELKLKRLVNRQGILGFDKLISYMLSEWMQDIKKNQLPSILGGVGPLSSLLQLFQGIKDLIWMPIEQYQKDGRIVRGLQRGANSFSTSTAMAILELASRMVDIVQTTAETTYDMVSPGPTLRIRGRGPRRRRTYNHPQDIREGVANACMLVREGLGETAAQLVRVASEEHEQKGVSGAVGGILFSIPKTVILPIVVATEATSNVIGGVVSSIQPDARREAVQKWRKQTDDNK